MVLQAVPTGIDSEEVSNYLLSIPGVKAVHDLHIWAMSTTETALTAHVVKPDLEDDDSMLERVRADFCERFGIEHVTLQVERSDGLMDCGDKCQPCKIENKNPHQ
jgi:cobalt-zinc-cadmium efflux system protein